MKIISPVLRKVLVNLEGMDQPLEFWWDDEMLNKFESIIEKNDNRILRAPNTPCSIVEFNLTSLINFRITSITEVLFKGNCFKSTNFFKYYHGLNIPVPLSTFNEEFEFPLTLICLLNKKTRSPFSIDFSNYINLDYLKNKELSMEDVFMEKDNFALTNRFEPKIIFAEFLSK